MVPIECATVMCVPCVNRLRAGIDIRIAKNRLIKIHKSESIIKEYETEKCFILLLRKIFSPEINYAQQNNPLCHTNGISNEANPVRIWDRINVVSPIEHYIDET